MRVIIVGAGLAGASVAWHLAPYADVVLVDAAAQPGTEATSQNAGMVRRMGEDPYERALAMRTHDWLCSPPPGFEGVSRRRGALLGLAHDRWHLHDAASHLTARGVEVVSTDAVAAEVPVLAGSPLPFGWWLPDERVVDPIRLVHAFLGRDPTLRLGEPVTALVERGGRVVGVRTPGGDIEGDAVVLAAGAWSGALGNLPLTPVRRTAFETEPHPLATDDHPWVWLDDVGLYARPRRGRWLLSPCEERMEPLPVARPSTGRAHDAQWQWVHERLKTWMPALADVRVARSWTGLRTFAPDRRPVLGADARRPGLYWAAGLGGFGVTCSVAVGETVAAWIRAEPTPWLAPDRVSPTRRVRAAIAGPADARGRAARAIPAP